VGLALLEFKLVDVALLDIGIDFPGRAKSGEGVV
jgi:hypothetical protein